MAFTRPLDVAQQMQALNGTPVYLGTIAATTTSSTNAFTIPSGSVLMISPDAAVQILPVLTSTSTVTTATGFPLAANEKFILGMDPGQTYNWIAAIAATTANVRVYAMT